MAIIEFYRDFSLINTFTCMWVIRVQYIDMFKNIVTIEISVHFKVYTNKNANIKNNNKYCKLTN